MNRALETSPALTQQAHRDSDGPDVLSQVQVCARLGISDESWRRWRKAGRTPEPITMPSGRLKWRRDDIDRLTGERREASGRRAYFLTASRHAAQSRFPRAVGQGKGGSR